MSCITSPHDAGSWSRTLVSSVSSSKTHSFPFSLYIHRLSYVYSSAQLFSWLSPVAYLRADLETLNYSPPRIFSDSLKPGYQGNYFWNYQNLEFSINYFSLNLLFLSRIDKISICFMKINVVNIFQSKLLFREHVHRVNMGNVISQMLYTFSYWIILECGVVLI